MFCSLCRWRKTSRACSFQSMRPVHNVNHFPGRLCRSTRKLWYEEFVNRDLNSLHTDMIFATPLIWTALQKQKVLYMRQVFSKCEAIRSFKQINISHYWASKDLKTAFKMLKVSHIRTELLELQATKVFIQKAKQHWCFLKCFHANRAEHHMPFHCSLTRRTPSHRYPSV